MKQATRSYSFLIEILLVILFFSLASIVSVQIFLRARENNERSKEQNLALITVQSILEETASSQKPENATLYFDKNWNAVSIDGAYAVRLTAEEARKTTAGSLWLLKADAVTTNDDIPLLELQTQTFVKNK